MTDTTRTNNGNRSRWSTISHLWWTWVDGLGRHWTRHLLASEAIQSHRVLEAYLDACECQEEDGVCKLATQDSGCEVQPIEVRLPARLPEKGGPHDAAARSHSPQYA